MKNTILLLFLIGIISPTFAQEQNTVSSNYSPLHWAAAQGYVEMMKVLVDKGYDINAQDINGFTPLHYAAASGNFGAVEFLINSGADVYIANNREMTPMTLAAQAGEQKIVDYLFVKMRSTRVDQLKAQAEKDRVNSDLAYAAKARAEAERLRQKASEWTKEATYWRAEAQKWSKEANILKEKQIQIDQIAKERLEKMLAEKQASEENFRAERLARNAAERLLREQNANTEAQMRAYEAQNAALAAQRATDAAIDNLAEEFLRQGIQYNPNNTNTYGSTPLSITVPSGYQSSQLPPNHSTQDTKMYFLDENSPSVPVDIIEQVSIPDDSSIELGASPKNTVQKPEVTSLPAEPPIIEEVDIVESPQQGMVEDEPVITEEIVKEEPVLEENVTPISDGEQDNTATTAPEDTTEDELTDEYNE